MRSTLRQEVEAFLRLHGPATGTAIAMGVRARRDDVDEVLAGDAFSVVPAPEGMSPRATYFGLSQRVPAQRKANTKRSRLLLSVLSDGRRHSRDEIFQKAGKFFLTNNAAAELRSQGFDVRYERERGVDVYWIEPAASVSLDAASAGESPQLPGEAASNEAAALFDAPARGAYGGEAA